MRRLATWWRALRRTPHGGRITPRDHADSIPVFLSPGSMDEQTAQAFKADVLRQINERGEVMDERTQRIKAIGKVLIRRRIIMDTTHHARRPGWVETVRSTVPIGDPYETVRDLETGARDDYDPTTLSLLEQVYKLQPGSLGEALQGGRLVAVDGEHLYPPPGHPDYEQ